MTDSQDLQKIKKKLNDPYWRLNNLYYIRDKKGNKVKFSLNWAQKHFYNNMWFLNIILKARQLGFTTFIQIFMLDRCLFNSNIAAGVIAHNREDAQDFFEKKIKFAYESLPDWLRNERKASTDSAHQLSFTNGSSIRVGTSLRSGTYQYLHISEFGKLCATRPDRAEEIIAGAINTVEAGCFVFMESTADGSYGRFFDMCQNSMTNAIDRLTKLDFKFFFFAWWQHPDYRLDGDVDISLEDEDYFSRLEASEEITLTVDQKNWYVKKKAVQMSKMMQEYPSTPQEAFEVISDHAVYGAEFKGLREQGRVKEHLPVDPNLQVHTFWDIGRSKTDATSIWFMQDVSNEYNFIDFYQNVQKPVGHYVTNVKSKGYNLGKHYLPHDATHNDYKIKSYIDRLVESGIDRSDIIVVPRIAQLNVGIDQTKQKLPFCNFDKNKCGVGLTALERYAYKYDEKKGLYIEPIHNWASHPSDAFRQFGQGYSRIDEQQPLKQGRKRHIA